MTTEEAILRVIEADSSRLHAFAARLMNWTERSPALWDAQEPEDVVQDAVCRLLDKKRNVKIEGLSDEMAVSAVRVKLFRTIRSLISNLKRKSRKRAAFVTKAEVFAARRGVLV